SFETNELASEHHLALNLKGLRDIKKLYSSFKDVVMDEAKDPKENDALAQMLEKLEGPQEIFLTEGNKLLIVYPIVLLQKIHVFRMTNKKFKVYLSIEDVKNLPNIVYYDFLVIWHVQIYLNIFNNICCIKIQ
ncbi:hypothetical protein ACJX0J_015942, partial [Zea mays]